MTRTLATRVVAGLACMGAAEVAAQTSAPDREMVARLDRYRAVHAQSQVEARPELLAEFRADSIRLMPPYHQTVMGEGNADAFDRAFSARFEVRTSRRTPLEMRDLGTMLLELGTSVQQVRSRRTGSEHELRARYLQVWRRAAAGAPELVTEVWHYEGEAELADELRLQGVPSVDVAHGAHVPVDSDISFRLAALNRLMEVVISQRDGGVWARFYTDDALLLARGGPVVRGRAAVDAYYLQHAQELPVFEHLDVRTDRIDDLGAFVLEYASGVAHWRHGASSGVSTGKDLRIWRREGDGSLKIAYHVGAYD